MAATGIVAGVDGSITYTSGYTTKVTSWQITVAVEDVDTTALGDDWRSRIPGLQEWSGTYTALIDTDQFTGSVGDLGIGAAAASADFIFDEPASTDGKLAGSIVITGVDVGVSVGSGASTATFTFVGSGALTLTEAA